MVSFFIYAKDVSASTNGCQYFHTNGLKTLEKFKMDVEKILEDSSAAESPPESKIIYLHWGHDCYEADEEEIRQTYINMEGYHYAARPDTIVKWLQEHYNICDTNNTIKLLYLITDGLTDVIRAEECFKLNKDMHYETVVLHGFNKNLKLIDLYVMSSFFKNRCKVYRNNKLYDKADISKEFNYEKINVHNFLTEIEPLKSYIRLKFVAKSENDSSVLPEINKLRDLRDRLLKELVVLIENNKVMLKTKDRDIFLREFINMHWYKHLTRSEYVNEINIDKSTSTLINYIGSHDKYYAFDPMRFDTNFHHTIPKKEVFDIDFTTEQEIKFSNIVLDDDKQVSVIVLTECNLLDKFILYRNGYTEPVKPWEISGQCKLKSIVECPLFLVNDQDISDSIGFFYTLNVYKQYLENCIETEPRTRKKFHGGLVLTNTKECDKYNDYIISATYFYFKKVNFNIGLFYFVLWKNCENKEWMDRNVVEIFKKYTMRRISETECKIGLTSLALDGLENTSLLAALWYCVELSSCLFKNDPRYFMHERLRLYYSVSRYMIEILEHFNYNINLVNFEKRMELVTCAMNLKTMRKRKEKFYYLLKTIFKTEGGFLVSEIEKPFNLYKLNYLKLKHKKILRDDIVEEKVNLNDYVHLMHIVGDFEGNKADKCTFDICEKTFRPFFAMEQNKSFYSELVENSRKVVIINDHDKDTIKVTFETVDSLDFSRTLSLYKLFINCVRELRKYPTLSEYAAYVLKEKKYTEDLVTIFPSNVYVGLKDVYERYQKILKKVEVQEFIKVSMTHDYRTERIKAEERVAFISDDDIMDFISREEYKLAKFKDSWSRLNFMCKMRHVPYML